MPAMGSCFKWRMTMKKLPIGVQTFSEIINGDYLYIDKTAIAYSLIDDFKYAFLSRPRRFGKSLFLDTLQNIFEGNRELFRGLLIEEKWNWEVTYPVIKIGFSDGLHSKADFEADVLHTLQSNEKRLGLECEERDSIPYFFQELIKEAYKKYHRRVVILIDDCDKPILDNIDNIPAALVLQRAMSDFQSIIKNNDASLYFVFLIGESKLFNSSLFGGLNNLENIGLNPVFGAVCGYTQHDVDVVFAPYLEGVDMAELKRWYNGYNFLGDNVYNPYDILLFIENGHLFKNYWFDAGIPKYFMQLIKENSYLIPVFSGFDISSSSLNSFDINNICVETLLFQSGCLAVKHEDSSSMSGVGYVLGCPNREVQTSVNDTLLELMTSGSDKDPICRELLAIMNTGEVERLEVVIEPLFASISGDNFPNNDVWRSEGFYASALCAYFASIRIDLVVENMGYEGGINLTMKAGGRTFFLEFKVKELDPLEQIKKMKYYEKYDGERYLIGIVFDPKQRIVSKFELERL